MDNTKTVVITYTFADLLSKNQVGVVVLEICDVPSHMTTKQLNMAKALLTAQEELYRMVPNAPKALVAGVQITEK